PGWPGHGHRLVGLPERRRTTEELLDNDLDPLELLELGVAGGGHRPPQGADEVHGAVGHPRGAEQDLLERPDALHLDPLASWQLGVDRLTAPVEALTGSVDRACQRRTYHPRVGPAGHGLGHVAATADR